MAAYQTVDIHIAAALLASGHRLEKVERYRGRGPKRAVFVFHDSQDLQADIVDYTNDDLCLPARELYTRLRELKAATHNLHL